MRKWLWLLSAVLVLAWRPSVASPEEPRFSEYEVKAAFIFNTLKFVEWPTDERSDVSLCVLGQNPFGRNLETVSGKTVKDKTLTVKNVHSLPEAKTCSIVFICRSEKPHLGEIVDGLAKTQALTMGDTDGFGEQGVMVNFYQEDARVRFQVNLEAAKKSRLKLDSRLLKLATIVSSK